MQFSDDLFQAESGWNYSSIMTASGWLFNKKSITTHGNMNVKLNNQNLGWYMASFLTATAVPHAGLISPKEFFLFPKFKFTFKAEILVTNKCTTLLHI
jgi:hypothetical protein